MQNQRRWPAEWEPHRATWMTWPCRSEIWTNGLEKAQLAFAEVANAIAEYEPLKMLVNPEHMSFAKSKLSSSIKLIECKIDDSWARDTAPIFIEENGEPLALDFKFNAWGNKFQPYDNDAKIAQAIIENQKLNSQIIDVVMEGGAIHSDGQGTILTTKECLLNPNRNPHLSQKQIEEVLLDTLGANKVIWLENGVFGDIDTDGHIDNIACFAEPGIIISQSCGERSENFLIYQNNREIINQHQHRLIQIPEPEARYEDGQRVPLSYINFYIANNLVVVPSFGCKQDDSAKQILHDMFPNRDIVQIDANEILVGGGGIHCITMQQPNI